MTITDINYAQVLVQRSADLNQRLEELKKLEAYVICTKDTLAYMIKFINSQSTELNSMLSLDKITKDTHIVSHEVLNNVAQSLKLLEEESLKNYYMKLGIANFIKQDISDITNSLESIQKQEVKHEISTSAIDQ